MIMTTTWNDCEHKFGLKRHQDSNTFYCPVCRVQIYEDTDEWAAVLSEAELAVVGKPSDYDWGHPIESTGQGRANTDRLDGERPPGSSSGKSLQWRKL